MLNTIISVLQWLYVQARSPFKSPYEHVPSILFVGQEDESLQCVDQERDGMNLSKGDTFLIRDKATCDYVLESLKEHTWAHFVCHGELESGKPFDASFKLFNGERLTLLDIIAARVPNAEQAFLAACHPAELTEGSAHDELLHLAAGMQFCGFRSVTGTMWAMLDEVGHICMRAYYKHMLADDGSPEKGLTKSARALHAVTKESKGNVPRELGEFCAYWGLAEIQVRASHDATIRTNADWMSQ